MRLPSQQQGLSPISMLLVVLVAAFFINAAIKLAPLYIESFTVDSAISKAIEENEFVKVSIGQIKRKIAKSFDINRIEGIQAKDIIVVTKKDGLIKIDASYERRVPLMMNIDVVLKFDTLVYEFKPESAQ